MSDTGAERIAPPTISPTALHTIACISWEREGYETLEVRRARLLDEIAQLLQWMAANPKLHFLLGGQSIILEDIASVRPDLLTLLVIYNAGGRLGIGPWYVQVDEALVSGESLVRNLLTARADAARYGLKMLPVGYMPTGHGHVGQLPQILRGFGIDAAFLCHGVPVAHMPFRWEGPDGSAILVVNHDNNTGSQRTTDSVYAVLDAQHEHSPSSPYLWMADSDTPLNEINARLHDMLDLPVIQSSLPAYVEALRKDMPDQERPVLSGELRLQGQREHSYLLPGMLSSRMYLKQANARLENLLTYAAEPWLALALIHGEITYPDNLRALLNYSWRRLLKNQSRNALGGSSCDAVHEANEIAFRQCEDSAREVIAGAMRALPGEPHWEAPTLPQSQKTSVVVWNAHNWPVQQVVEVPLRVPGNLYPAEMADPEGTGVLYSWQETTSPEDSLRGERVGLLSFMAAAPPVGYSVYSVYLSNEAPEYIYPEHSSGKTIGTVPDPITLSVEGDQLITRVTEPPFYDDEGRLVAPAREEAIISDLLSFYDGGDAGDVYTYCPPDPDFIVKADLSGDVHMESTAIYQRLILSHRLRIAPSLRPDGGRDRGVKLMELTTTATLYDYMPGVYFQTTFRNPVRDHRLRAHLRTGIASDEVLAGSVFDVVSRRAVLEGSGAPFANRPNREAISNTYPMSNVCAVQDDRSGMALLARGLPEYEAIPEDGQITLALTLMRAVGWLSRGDLRTRTASIGPLVAVQGAQCRRLMTAEYALVPIWPNDPALLRTGCEYNAPLQAYQYRQPPDATRNSFLSVEGEGVLMTALKPPQTGSGLIVRLLNPTGQIIDVNLHALAGIRSAVRANLAEEMLEELPVEKGRIALRLNPRQIETLRLGFG